MVLFQGIPKYMPEIKSESESGSEKKLLSTRDTKPVVKQVNSPNKSLTVDKTSPKQGEKRKQINIYCRVPTL